MSNSWTFEPTFLADHGNPLTVNREVREKKPKIRHIARSKRVIESSEEESADELSNPSAAPLYHFTTHEVSAPARMKSNIFVEKHKASATVKPVSASFLDTFQQIRHA